MSGAETTIRHVGCRCGNVAFEARGEPILSAICQCASCQKAGAILAAAGDGAGVLDANGGTPFVLFRKDRIACNRGADLLGEYRLTPKSPTRRVVAQCCATPMFLEFSGGHWLSVYAARLPDAERPAMEMRVMARDRRAGVEFDDGLPSFASHSGRFMWRLLWAWAAMGFRAPKLDYVKGEVSVQG